MSRLGEAPVPVGAPVPAPPWLGVGMGHVEKPRIRLTNSAVFPRWVCAGAGCIGVGRRPVDAYYAWRKDVERLQAWRDAEARGPIAHPKAVRLLADLEAAIAARPAGWWRRMLPGAGRGRP